MTNKKKKIWGIVLVVYPIVGLPLVLMMYAIFSFIASTGTAITLFRVMNLILGLLGLICVLGIFIAIPIGIVLLVQSSKKEEAKK